MNYSSKIQKILDEQNKAKNKLIEIKQQRAYEVGRIAVDHGIDILDNRVLKSAFKEIYDANR
tara:strand:- start:391 stop:576 length:186 start_codon:yes stop_codon:yes gene_type:complete